MGNLGRILGALTVVSVAYGLVGGSGAAAELAGSAGSSVFLTATITAIDLERGALKVAAIKQPGQPSPSGTEPDMVLLDPQTIIRKDGQQLKPEQLKVGDQVHIAYVSQANQHVAQSITVQKGSASEPTSPDQGAQTPQPQSQPGSQ